MIQGLASKNYWQRNLHYPNWCYSYGDLLEWFTSLEAPTDKQVELINTITSEKHTAILDRSVELYNGCREDVIKLLPVSVASHPPVLWPPERVKKIILLSATISQVDIEELGLDKERRVIYFEIESSIPPAQRPLILDYVGNLNYHNTKTLIPKLVDSIHRIEESKNSRGFIHTTYAMAKLLKPHLDSDTYLFHTAEDATIKINEWKCGNLPHKVFVGCGFEEGIDLAGPEFGWQIITKIQYPSLADPAIKFKAQETGEAGQMWYVWQALKAVMQASGRICRGPSDYGETFILDGSFRYLIEQSLKYNLIPKWFKEVLDYKGEIKVQSKDDNCLDLDTLKF
jgi:Rad3-related DNA helicase